MTYQQDIEYDLETQVSCECRYIIASHHRRVGNPNKSIWTISNSGEIECFVFSFISNWFEENICWGVSAIGADLQVVGKNNYNEDLKIAKFIDSNNNKIWHGYPADYMRKAQDRPATQTLHDWVGKGFITKAKMSKIRQGQSCNL